MIHNFATLLKKHLREGDEINSNNIFSAIFLGSVAHSMNYLFHKYFFGLNESLIVRSIAIFLCLTVGVYFFLSPKVQKNYFPFYWHLMLIVALPFAITYLTLINNFANLWLLWMIFMPMVLAIFVPSWLIYLIDLFLGLLTAFLVYYLTGNILKFEGFNLDAFCCVFFSSSVLAVGFVYGNRTSWLKKQEDQHNQLNAIACSIAHELRNPIGLIRLYSATLDTQNDEIKKYKEQLVKTLCLANNIIDTTLQELGDTLSDKEIYTSLSAQKSILESLDIYSYKSLEDKQRIKIDFDNDVILTLEEIENQKFNIDNNKDFVFRAVEATFKYILINLIKNAFFYIDQFPDSNIIIGIKKNKVREYSNESKIYNEIYVYDNGHGIKEKELSDLFDDYTDSNLFNLNKNGNGLGFSFYKKKMLLFGGDITCESQIDKQNNGWTKFSMLFPKLTADEFQAWQKEEQKIINQKSKELQESQIITDKMKELMKNKKIILADDEMINRMVTKHFLVNYQLEVVEATDGKNLVQIYQNSLDIEGKSSFDLIITDINMHPYNGDLAAKEIRDIENKNWQSLQNSQSSKTSKIKKTIPIIALSGESGEQNLTHFFKCGINQLVIKGTNPELLVKVIAENLI